jgi:hypothetical protein
VRKQERRYWTAQKKIMTKKHPKAIRQKKLNVWIKKGVKQGCSLLFTTYTVELTQTELKNIQ